MRETTSRESKLPAHIIEYFGDARSFKQSKRAGIRQIIEEIDSLAIGMAFAPNETWEKHVEMRRLAQEIQRDVSIKSWGR